MYSLKKFKHLDNNYLLVELDDKVKNNFLSSFLIGIDNKFLKLDTADLNESTNYYKDKLNDKVMEKFDGKKFNKLSKKHLTYLADLCKMNLVIFDLNKLNLKFSTDLDKRNKTVYLFKHGKKEFLLMKQNLRGMVSKLPVSIYEQFGGVDGNVGNVEMLDDNDIKKLYDYFDLLFDLSTPPPAATLTSAEAEAEAAEAEAAEAKAAEAEAEAAAKAIIAEKVTNIDVDSGVKISDSSSYLYFEKINKSLDELQKLFPDFDEVIVTAEAAEAAEAAAAAPAAAEEAVEAAKAARAAARAAAREAAAAAEARAAEAAARRAAAATITVPASPGTRASPQSQSLKRKMDHRNDFWTTDDSQLSHLLPDYNTGSSDSSNVKMNNIERTGILTSTNTKEKLLEKLNRVENLNRAKRNRTTNQNGGAPNNDNLKNCITYKFDPIHDFGKSLPRNKNDDNEFLSTFRFDDFFDKSLHEDLANEEGDCYTDSDNDGKKLNDDIKKYGVEKAHLEYILKTYNKEFTYKVDIDDKYIQDIQANVIQQNNIAKNIATVIDKNLTDYDGGYIFDQLGAKYIFSPKDDLQQKFFTKSNNSGKPKFEKKVSLCNLIDGAGVSTIPPNETPLNLQDGDNYTNYNKIYQSYFAEISGVANSATIPKITFGINGGQLEITIDKVDSPFTLKGGFTVDNLACMMLMIFKTKFNAGNIENGSVFKNYFDNNENLKNLYEIINNIWNKINIDIITKKKILYSLLFTLKVIGDQGQARFVKLYNDNLEQIDETNKIFLITGDRMLFCYCIIEKIPVYFQNKDHIILNIPDKPLFENLSDSLKKKIKGPDKITNKVTNEDLEGYLEKTIVYSMQVHNEFIKTLSNSNYNNLLELYKSSSTPKEFMFTSDIYVFNEELQEIGEEVIKALLLELTKYQNELFSNIKYINKISDNLKDSSFTIETEKFLKIKNKISLITKYIEKIVMQCYKNIIFDEEIIKLNNNSLSDKKQKEEKLKEKYAKIFIKENGALDITNIKEILIREIRKAIRPQYEILTKVSRFSKVQGIPEYQNIIENIKTYLNIPNIDLNFSFSDIKAYMVVLRIIMLTIIEKFREKLESNIEDFVSKKIKKILINGKIEEKVNDELDKIDTDDNDKLLLTNITKEFIINKNEDIKNFLNNLEVSS